ncbi:uncharacterized protein LOC130641704 [Hydractinia symbiolongicarpus]|uniref:uncharacterized protein LOC130641704 n=1 Tax=Hydractinia symbiolongicarpus TaxID=13093 RepID=UPI00254ED675|nr:uncharacterized protein LOC130641704 [Hydractinia symbiolongicarpus]XP_057304612.1 uncharacterized protein LOC130641704 [Hydractinia symbiolongicarpus]
MGNKCGKQDKYAVDNSVETIKDYCRELPFLKFFGQTNMEGEKNDVSSTKNVSNLGSYLSLLDEFLRGLKNVEDFTGEEEKFVQLLSSVSTKRKKEGETTKTCFKRLKIQSKRFSTIYRKRGVISEKCEHQKYWGTRQQLLAGKVIADWLETKYGCLDPIFGVLMNPTAGRVGPGDSCWIHNMLNDDTGYMAYHSVVHDGFGYLYTFHKIGPGYDYMCTDTLDDDNPMAGQIDGIKFWRETLKEIETKLNVLKKWKSL